MTSGMISPSEGIVFAVDNCDVVFGPHVGRNKIEITVYHWRELDGVIGKELLTGVSRVFSSELLTALPNGSGNDDSLFWDAICASGMLNQINAGLSGNGVRFLVQQIACDEVTTVEIECPEFLAPEFFTPVGMFESKCCEGLAKRQPASNFAKIIGQLRGDKHRQHLGRNVREINSQKEEAK